MNNSTKSEQNNEELSSEDLRNISGGGVFAKLDGVKGKSAKRTEMDTNAVQIDQNLKKDDTGLTYTFEDCH